MSKNHPPVSAMSEIWRSVRGIAASALALALLLPSGAAAMDSTPRQTFDQARYALPLPPVRFLDSMRWMDWKPAAPVFKIDTLLLPGQIKPGIFELPSDGDRYLPHVS
jgi:hypothetical protein